MGDRPFSSAAALRRVGVLGRFCVVTLALGAPPRLPSDSGRLCFRAAAIRLFAIRRYAAKWSGRSVASTLSRSLWARSSPRFPSDSGKNQSHCVGLGLLPSLQSKLPRRPLHPRIHKRLGAREETPAPRCYGLSRCVRHQWLRRTRPLARRRARTLRPLAVAMRLRNPWTLER